MQLHDAAINHNEVQQIVLKSDLLTEGIYLCRIMIGKEIIYKKIVLLN